MAKASHATAPKVEQVARAPVTATGDDLLKLLYENGGVYLTQSEGAAAIAAGDAHVNLDDTQGDTALVMLTPQGAAKVAPTSAAKAGKPMFEVDDDVPMPTKSPRGGKRGSKYPFEALQVGQSFHVPKTKENPDPVSALASSLTGARRRFSIPMLGDNNKPVMETVTTKTYKLDASGKRVKGADGKWIVTGEAEVSRQKLKETRDFMVVAVDKTDPKGVGARVFRKL